VLKNRLYLFEKALYLILFFTLFTMVMYLTSTKNFMNRYDGLDEKVIFMVHTYAKKLFNRRVFHFMDVEDFEQELMLEVLKSLEDYKEHLGNMESFLGTVIRNSANELLKKNFCLKRDGGVVFEELVDEFVDHTTSTDIDRVAELIDFSKAIDYLPLEKKILCMFARRHTLPEISRIFGINRATLHSKFKIIKKLLKEIYCSQNFYCSGKTLTTLEKYMKNISVLETLTAKEISRLDPADLMELNDQVTNLNSQAKEMRQKLDDGLNLRFAEAVKNSLKSEGKDTGTTRFFDGAHQIIAEVPKKVTWDSEKMEGIIQQISEEKRKDLIKVTYAVDERKYLALPYGTQELFKDARTVTPGKARFQIQLETVSNN